MPALFPHQQDGAAWLASKPAGFLADGMRVGKAVQAVEAANRVMAVDLLVITVTTATDSFAGEIERWQDLGRSIEVVRGQRGQLPAADALVIGWDLLPHYAFELMTRRWRAVVIDEARKAKEATSSRTRIVYGQRCDRAGGIVDGVPYVWPLDGTPAPNHPLELWPHLRALAPELILNRQGRPMSSIEFRNRYCDWFSYPGTDRIKIKGGKNLPELRQRTAPFFLRRTRDQVAPGVKPVIRELPVRGDLTEVTALELGPEGQALRAALAQGVEALADVADGSLARAYGIAKADPVADIVADEIDAGLRKIVLFAWHTDVIRILARRLKKYGLVQIVGGMGQSAKQRSIDAFQGDDNVRVALCQIIAANSGVPLHAADDVLFVELFWVPGENAQAAARIENLAKIHNSLLVRYATLQGSFDVRVQDALRSKLATSRALFG